MLVGQSIKRAVQNEIKALQSLKATLEKHSKNYDADYSKEIAQIDESISNYKKFINE